MPNWTRCTHSSWQSTWCADTMGLIRKNAGFQCSSSTVHALVAMRPKPKHDQGTFSTINPPSVRLIDASFCCVSCITAAALCFIVKPSHRCHLRVAFAGSLNSQRAERHPSWHFIGIRFKAFPGLNLETRILPERAKAIFPPGTRRNHRSTRSCTVA